MKYQTLVKKTIFGQLKILFTTGTRFEISNFFSVIHHEVYIRMRIIGCTIICSFIDDNIALRNNKDCDKKKR